MLVSVKVQPPSEAGTITFPTFALWAYIFGIPIHIRCVEISQFWFLCCRCWPPTLAWAQGSAYQKQQGRASWDIYVTFIPRRGISPLRPSLLVPEPRLLLKLVTRIAAFPILESRGSGPAVFTFKVETSFFSFPQLKVSGRSGIPSLSPVWTRPRQCILWGHRLWWAGCGETGAFCKSY